MVMKEPSVSTILGLDAFWPLDFDLLREQQFASSY